MKKYILLILIIALLAFLFWWGGNSPSLHGWDVNQPEKEAVVIETEPVEEAEPVVEPEKPVAHQKPTETVEAEPVRQQKDKTCTLIVRCDSVLKSSESIPEEILAAVPTDGVIYSRSGVEFKEGASVFDVLLSEFKANRLHLEYVSTPLYKSAYIEGINNLYEFDCGELSGWMYKVNGIFPKYGCSLAIVNDKDVIEFVYTCDFGKDVGGDYLSQRG